MRTEKILIPSILVISLLLFAFLSPKLTPFDISEQNLMIAKNAPSLSHIMGTDIYGRDMFSRVIAAGRISVFSALAVVLLMSITGVIVGLFCGYLGGIADTVACACNCSCGTFPKRNVRCDNRIGIGGLAKICKTCKRAGTFYQNIYIYKCRQTQRQQYRSDSVYRNTAQYHRTDCGNGKP